MEATKTLPLTVRNMQTATKTLTLTINPASSGSPPTVNSFTIKGDPSTATAAPGEAMPLVWDVSGATEVQLTTGDDYSWFPWPASGTASVSANGSRNFFLRARNGGSVWQTFVAVHTIIPQPASAPDLTGTARYDDFTRADSASSLGSPSDGGAPWTAQSGTWGISSDQARNVSGGSHETALLDTPYSDAVVSVTLPAIGSSPGLVFRGTDADNYFFFKPASGTYELFKRSSGTETLIDFLLNAHTPTDGDVLRVNCIGSTITCYVNDVLGITSMQTFNQTATKHGLQADSDSVSRFSNFVVADSSKLLDPALNILDLTINATTHSTRAGSWFDASVWSGGVVPGSADVAWVQHAITVDGFSDVPVSGIGVRPGGSLLFSTALKTRLTACHVVVYDTDGTHPQGYLEIGNSSDPVNPSAVQDQTACLALTSAPYATADASRWGSGLYVFGKVRTYGQPKSPGFVRLASAPQVGDRTLSLSVPVVGWVQGDRLFLPDSHLLTTNERWFGTTNPIPQYEALMLEAVSPDGLTLTVSTVTGGGLAFDHPGSSRPGDNVVEYLPHVANLSRWASIRTVDPTDVNRPHVIICNRADVDFQQTTIHSTGRPMPKNGRPIQFRRLWGPHPVRADGYQFSMTGCSVLDPFPIPGLVVAGAAWGVTLDEASWGLIRDNCVVNWGGGGIVPRNGNERANGIDGNFVSLIRGSGGRFPGTAGDGTFNQYGQGEGVGIWSRNVDQVIRNNVISDVRSPQVNGNPFCYGIGLTPLTDAGTVLLAFADTPAYQGANPYSGVPGDAVGYSPQITPIRLCDSNEVYGGYAGMTFWYVDKVDFSFTVMDGSRHYVDLPPATPGGVVSNLVCWNVCQYGVFIYPTLNVTLENCVFRGGSAADQSEWPDTGIFFSDYGSMGFKAIGCDVQGFNFGGGLPENAEAATTYQNCHFACITNIVASVRATSAVAFLNQFNYALNLDNVAGPFGTFPFGRTLTLDNCTYTAVPGHPLLSIIMDAPGDYDESWTSPTVVTATAHNGVAGDDFQAYFAEQDPAFVLPVSNPAAPALWCCPEAGLTNQQAHDKYNFDGTVKSDAPNPATPGLCFVCHLLPAGATTRPDIQGRVK